MLNAQLLQLPGRFGKMQRIGVRPRQLRAERCNLKIAARMLVCWALFSAKNQSSNRSTVTTCHMMRFEYSVYAI